MELWIFLGILAAFFLWAGWRTRGRHTSDTGPTASDEISRQGWGDIGYRPHDDGGKPRP